MRLFRLRVVSCAFIPLLFLAACSSANTDVKPAGALDGITVGGPAKAPTLLFKTKPVSVKDTTTKVITAGKGATVSKANTVTFNYVVFNGKDGKQIASSFDKKTQRVDLSSTNGVLSKGLSKGLTGQHLGSRLLVAIPPADAFGPQGSPQAGFGPTDNVVFLIDLVSAATPPKPLTKATGDPVKPPAGLPTVKEDAKGVPVVTVPKTQPSAKLVVQPLIKGKGAVVEAGQELTAAYTGLVYGTGKVFDSSYTSGNPLKRPVGVGQLVAGFDKGIVGQTVGSRVLLVLPPTEGYGKAGNPQAGIKGTDTIVFIVDILAAS